MILKNGLIHDAVHAQPYVASIALRDGKIAAIAQDLAPWRGRRSWT